MANAGYIGLSLQMALREQMDVVANNVANISTSGFKGERMMFKEQLTQRPQTSASIPGITPRLSMVIDQGTYRDTSDGSFQMTGNQLDVAIQGNGYLAVQAADGVRYTRAGGMQLNADRQLCDRNGFVIQGDGGPITIPQQDNDINITPEGAVVTESGQQGSLRVVRFANDQALQLASGGTYKTSQAALPAADVTIKQGGIETSNVQPVVEMTRMIDLQRAYENVQHLLDSEHDRQNNAITQLAQVN